MRDGLVRLPLAGKGTFYAAYGTATSCCFIKDHRRCGLGRIDQDDPFSIIKNRTKLLKQLQIGILPENCRDRPFIDRRR